MVSILRLVFVERVFMKLFGYVMALIVAFGISPVFAEAEEADAGVATAVESDNRTGLEDKAVAAGDQAVNADDASLEAFFNEADAEQEDECCK